MPLAIGAWNLLATMNHGNGQGIKVGMHAVRYFYMGGSARFELYAVAVIQHPA